MGACRMELEHRVDGALHRASDAQSLVPSPPSRRAQLEPRASALGDIDDIALEELEKEERREEDERRARGAGAEAGEVDVDR